MLCACITISFIDQYTVEDPEMFTTTIVIQSSTNNGLANQVLVNDDELQCTRFFMLSILSTVPEVFISPDSSFVIQIQDDEGDLILQTNIP